MKKSTLFLTLALLFLTGAFAQSPEKLNYQALVKDTNGDAVSSQNISVQLNINKDTATGTTVYTETHTVTTSLDGLLTLIIGDGTTTDDFTSLSWGNNTYFLNVAVDLNSGTTYSDIGTQQLVSVPYALHANTSESSIQLEDASGNTKLIANSNQIAMKLGFLEPFKFANNKMTFKGGFPNFGSNLQLEFTDGENSNKIESISPNLTVLPTPGIVDYKLNLNVKGNETLSARGDGTIRINDSYSLPSSDGTINQALVTDGAGNVNWSGVKTSSIRDTDNDTKIQVEESADEDIIRFDLKGTEYFRMKKGRIETLNNGLSVFIGQNAGENDDLTENENVGIGAGALQHSTTGAANTSIGAFSMNTLTEGSKNTAIGIGALQSATIATENVSVGTGSLSTTVTGSGNVAVGFEAGLNNKGSGNVMIGYRTDFNGLVFNKLAIDNSNTTTPLIFGDFSSDKITINGTFETTSNATVNGNSTTTGSTTTNTLKIGNSSTLNGIYKVAVFKNVGNVGGNSSRIETFTVTGASPGDVVFVSPSENLQSQVVIGQAWVSSNNTVSVRFRNTDGGSQDPDSGNGATYYISVIK